MPLPVSMANVKRLLAALAVATLLTGCIGGSSPSYGSAELQSVEKVGTACEDGIENPRNLPFSSETIENENADESPLTISWVVSVNDIDASVDGGLHKVNESRYNLNITTTAQNQTTQCQKPVLKYRASLNTSTEGNIYIDVYHNDRYVGEVKRVDGEVHPVHISTPEDPKRTTAKPN